jgi:PAS domain S-box-containing protein
VSLTQARVEFAAEFVTLVVIASTLALLVLRPPASGEQLRRPVGDGERLRESLSPTRTATTGPAWPPPPAGNGEQRRSDADPRGDRSARAVQQVLAGLALLVLGAASFAHGSVLVSGPDVRWIGLGRLLAGGLALLAFPYPGGPRTGRTPIGGVLLRVGFLCWSAAGAVEWAQGSEYVCDGLLFAGALLAATAMVRVSRRSIAVRVAASGAATLLLVVIVLALALSSVISSSVQKQQLAELSDRAATEKALITDTAQQASGARTIEVYLTAAFPQQFNNPLALFATGTAAQRAAAAQSILAALKRLPPATAKSTIAYTGPDGKEVLVAGSNQIVTSAGFATEPDLAATCRAGEQGLFILGGQLVLAASAPLCTDGGTLLGVVVQAVPLDDAYLGSRVAVERGTGMALVTPSQVLARAGTDDATARQATLSVNAAPGQSVSQPLGAGFVNVTGLTVATASGRKGELYLVVDDTTNNALADRNSLFRTLFLIAFGGTILALGLAVFTGDRITARLRSLTRAATGITSGDTSVRAAVPGDDEIASLGSAFDTMIDSVSAQSAALKTAADDETRLRNRLEAVVAGMNDGLVAVDTYGRITDFNRAAAELTGVDAEQAVGQPALRAIRLRTEDGIPLGGQLLESGGRAAAMLALLVRDGEEIPVAVSAGALHGPAGEPAGRVLVIRDMRREQEVERMKTEFLSRIGHELRTPLTGILGYADILLRRPVREDMARAWYEDILHSARRLLRIVEMLEFFASEGAGRVVLRPAPVDLRSLVNGITSSWAGRLPPNLTIGRRLPRGETMVVADRRWLTLAVDELIDNAVKFSPEGGRILLKVTPGPTRIEIEVADQGMGMTPQHHDVIFGDFVQGDNSDTRRFGGLGLGLAVVRRVVEGHGGSIVCRSVPGRGTTFVLGLPTPGTEEADLPAPTADEATSPTARSEAAGAAARAPKRRAPRSARPSPTNRDAAP